MPVTPFTEILAEAERGGYAVGYFESWDMNSLLAVADAAEARHSPVLLGFSGIYLPHPGRFVADPLSVYAALGLEVCASLSVPTALVYNESPDLGSVLAAVDLGFGMVMYADGEVSASMLEGRVRQVSDYAHAAGGAVEGELDSIPGLDGRMDDSLSDIQLSRAETALKFVADTGVDAYAVNVGQRHLHGRMNVRLDFERLSELSRSIPVPLVLHGASSVSSADLAEAIRLGIRKINVGSRLKQDYFNALRRACGSVGADHNPYEVIGSGLPADVQIQARLALQKSVEELMVSFGSAGKA